MEAVIICALSFITRFLDAEAELSADIRPDELKAHVYRLASAEFMGRQGPGAARAARHLERAFQVLPLQPGFGTLYCQPIPWLLKEGSFVGRNVAARLTGSDPLLRDEWVVIGAHFDHLGQEADRFFPGADDNASGVAMLLEVAEQFALRKERPRRSVLFVAFDQEEAGLLGSTHFATHPPFDIKKIRAVLTADMLGRSMANVMDEYVFALGSESSPGLRRLLDGARPPRGLKIGRLGADLIGTRSDYGPFRDRRVPFLFLSTGQHPDYHQPTDTPDRVDYDKLQRISVWIGELAWRLANDSDAVVWDEQHGPDMAELRTLIQLMARILERPRAVRLSEGQRARIGEVQQRLKEMLARGRVTADERSWLVWTTRLMLATVF